MTFLRPCGGSSPGVSLPLWARVGSLVHCWSCSVRAVRSPPPRGRFSTHLGFCPWCCLWMVGVRACWYGGRVPSLRGGRSFPVSSRRLLGLGSCIRHTAYGGRVGAWFLAGECHTGYLGGDRVVQGVWLGTGPSLVESRTKCPWITILFFLFLFFWTKY